MVLTAKDRSQKTHKYLASNSKLRSMSFIKPRQPQPHVSHSTVSLFKLNRSETLQSSLATILATDSLTVN